ncbi:MAG: efflux RND transporter permease subunit, partial [Chloroflexota bacterium]|nr:efflux RND transporter permease subunit [Chloroflexota bacterium]
LGNAETAGSLGQREIASGGGRTVRLNSIATVRDQYGEQRSYGISNDRQVVSFQVVRAKGTSDVAVYDAVQAELTKITEAHPEITIEERYNTVDQTRATYKGAMRALVEGSILAVLVVFLFLRDWRATLVSALAIPLSAIPTFWFMEMMGYTLNGVTLLSLSLVAGVLVDDAIVEIENIVRHMRMGKSPYQAAIEAADEIGLAVVATTFSIVAVFLPVGLMGGFIGQYFKSFGFTIVVAVLISLLVARLITPMVAAYFLKSKGHRSHGEGWFMDRYMSLLHWSLRHRWKTVSMGVAAFVATIFAFGTLQFTNNPQVNEDVVSVGISMPPGTTLEQTRAVAERTAALLRQEPDVETTYASVRAGGGNVFARLKEEREHKSFEFERYFLPKLATIPNARIFFRQMGGMGGGGGGGGRAVTVMLAGSNPELLRQTALKVVEEMQARPEFRAPRIEGDLPRPEITITPRPDLAANMGVTTQTLSQAVRIATQGEIDQGSARFSLASRQVPIRVQVNEASRRNIATIENMPVPTTTGGTVPLRVVADISFRMGPSSIQRFNQERRVVIGSDLAPGVVAYLPIINELPTMQNLPQGVHRATQGDQKFMVELLENFVIAVVSGIVLVLAVLILLYKRLMAPFVNLGSLLLAPLGGALALHLTGNPLSMPVLIGILMLLGIVAKNSILLVDFAIEEMDRGVDKDVAIADAGHKRAQPIVMTTLAMVAGMIPTALALEGDASWRQPMGIVVIGGLLLSTVLTLVIVP